MGLQAMRLQLSSEALKTTAAIAVVMAGLKLVEPLLVPLLLAACLAAASAPLALWLRGRGAPVWVGATATLLLDVLVVAAVMALLGASVNEFQARLPQYTAKLVSTSAALSAWLHTKGLEVSPTSLYRIADPASLVGVVGSTLTSLAAMFSELVLVLLVVFFVLLELSTFREKLRVILSDADESLVRVMQSVREVQRYLLIKTVLSVLTGALSGVLLAALAVDFTIILALFAFFLNYIPNLGMLISLVPAAIIALVERGPGTALAVIVGYAVIHLVIGSIVEPRVLGRTMGLSPLVVLLSMIFWGWLWGPTGALLSVPLTMILKLTLSKNRQLRWIAVLLGPAPSETGGPAGQEALLSPGPP